MARQQRRQVKTIPMEACNDPALWRYANEQEALAAAIPILVQLIRDGEQINPKTPSVERDKCQPVMETSPLARTA